MFKGREKVRADLTPMRGEASSDVLSKTWEAYATATNKDFNSDRVLLSCSHEVFVDITKKIKAHGQQITTLQPVNIAEFKDHIFTHTLDNAGSEEFNNQRLRRYSSPFMLNGALPHFDDKFEAVVAVDTAMAIIETFHESH